METKITIKFKRNQIYTHLNKCTCRRILKLWNVRPVRLSGCVLGSVDFVTFDFLNFTFASHDSRPFLLRSSTCLSSRLGLCVLGLAGCMFGCTKWQNKSVSSTSSEVYSLLPPINKIIRLFVWFMQIFRKQNIWCLKLNLENASIKWIIYPSNKVAFIKPTTTLARN